MIETSIPLSTGYKDTETGSLPEDWEVVRLGRVFSPVPKRDRQVVIKDGCIYRLLTVRLYSKGLALRAEIEGGKIGTKTLFETKVGDFIFSKIDARNGAWGFVSDELSGALVSGDFPILALNKEEANKDFIELALGRPSIWEPLRQLAVGTTNRRRLQVSQLLDILIPLPPLPEQRAIAQVLRTVQRARETTEAVIASTRELKKSLMRHLFTYGPVPVDQADQVPLKDTEIGRVPEHWEVTCLKGVISRAFGGGTPSTKESDLWNGPIPWTTTAVIRADDVYLRSYQRGITESALRRSATRLAPKGSVLIGTRVGVGKAAVATFDVAVNQDITVVIPDSQLHAEFLALFLKLPELQSWFEANKRGATIRGVPREDVLSLQMPLPPLAEQQEIARILAAVDRKIEAEENRKQALEALFKSLLHNLMTGKVRVREVLDGQAAE